MMNDLKSLFDLQFYGTMCAIYSLYAIFWIVCSLYYWRELLRIQIWIGAVIILGLMEKAAYLAEYDEINRNGYACKIISGTFLLTH